MYSLFFAHWIWNHRIWRNLSLVIGQLNPILINNLRFIQRCYDCWCGVQWLGAFAINKKLWTINSINIQTYSIKQAIKISSRLLLESDQSQYKKENKKFIHRKKQFMKPSSPRYEHYKTYIITYALCAEFFFFTI